MPLKDWLFTKKSKPNVLELIRLLAVKGAKELVVSRILASELAYDRMEDTSRVIKPEDLDGALVYGVRIRLEEVAGAQRRPRRCT